MRVVPAVIGSSIQAMESFGVPKIPNAMIDTKIIILMQEGYFCCAQCLRFEIFLRKMGSVPSYLPVMIISCYLSRRGFTEFHNDVALVTTAKTRNSILVFKFIDIVSILAADPNNIFFQPDIRGVKAVLWVNNMGLHTHPPHQLHPPPPTMKASSFIASKNNNEKVLRES